MTPTTNSPSDSSFTPVQASIPIQPGSGVKKKKHLKNKKLKELSQKLFHQNLNLSRETIRLRNENSEIKLQNKKLLAALLRAQTLATDNANRVGNLMQQALYPVETSSQQPTISIRLVPIQNQDVNHIIDTQQSNTRNGGNTQIPRNGK